MIRVPKVIQVFILWWLEKVSKAKDTMGLKERKGWQKLIGSHKVKRLVVLMSMSLIPQCLWFKFFFLFVHGSSTSAFDDVPHPLSSPYQDIARALVLERQGLHQLTHHLNTQYYPLSFITSLEVNIQNIYKTGLPSHLSQYIDPSNCSKPSMTLGLAAQAQTSWKIFSHVHISAEVVASISRKCFPIFY